MEQLKGMTILIGREEGQGRLLVSTSVNGQMKAIAVATNVPGTVSRCKPQQNSAHAKIEINGNGTMIITNMKSANVTYVDGVEVESKRITSSSQIALGRDKYAVDLNAVLKAVSGLMPPPPKVYNISHLENVWNEYHDGLKTLREGQRKVNLIRSGCGIFTMCAMPCIYFLGPAGYVLTGIGIIGNIYSFVGLKNDNTADVQERLTEEFQDHYVCPNPDCGKFLGNMPFKMLKKQYGMSCPYCHSKFEE